MKRKIFFILLVASLLIVFPLFFKNKIDKNADALVLKKNYPAEKKSEFKNNSEKINTSNNKIFNQIEKNVSLEEINKNFQQVASAFKKDLKNKICPQVAGAQTRSPSDPGCPTEWQENSREQEHYPDQNLKKEGGWGYSTGGKDSTRTCSSVSATKDCGKGSVTPPPIGQYRGEIRQDGPIIQNVKYCKNHRDSCEKKCQRRGYQAHIWNSATKECGCAN